MRIDRHLTRLLSASLLLIVAACGGDRAVPTAAVPAESEMSAAALEATLNSERVRTANNALASARTFDALQAETSASLGGLLDGLGSTVSGLLLNCQALPYDSDVKIIGPSGGVLRVGPHTLVFPPGALSQNTVITAEAPASRYAQVKLSPHGLKFTNWWAKPMLTLSYSHCSGLLSTLPKRIVYVDANFSILESLLSLDLSRYKSVSAPLDHFSSYVVAY
jgi:hypothetical protein